MPKATITCPNCGEEIDYLNYNASTYSSGWESGTAGLDGECMEYGDSETNDTSYEDTEFECPECNESIDTLTAEEMEALKKDTKKKAPPPLTEVQDLDENPTGPMVEINSRWDKVRMYTCPDCKYTRELDSEEKAVICDKCSADYAVTEKNTITY